MATNIPTADFVATSLNGALAAAATVATIGTGLSIPATNGILQIDYDSTTAVGADNGPETIKYATYTTGTGALAGMTRGVSGTTDVAHANGAKVQCGMSESFILDPAVVGTTAGQLLNFVPKTTVTDAGDFTTIAEQDFTDWDLTALTSATAVAVLLRLQISDDTAGSYVAVRKNGDAGVADQSGYCQVINTSFSTYADVYTQCDASQVVEVKINDQGGAQVLACRISVLGWWEPVSL